MGAHGEKSNPEVVVQEGFLEEAGGFFLRAGFSPTGQPHGKGRPASFTDDTPTSQTMPATRTAGLPLGHLSLTLRTPGVSVAGLHTS